MILDNPGQSELLVILKVAINFQKTQACLSVPTYRRKSFRKTAHVTITDFSFFSAHYFIGLSLSEKVEVNTYTTPTDIYVFS
jgi:hypothetical protein